MMSLSEAVHQQGVIVDTMLSREDHDARVFTPANPLPRRWLASNPARWEQNGPDFTKVKTIRNWGWLRRLVSGDRYLSTSGLVNPVVGTAFFVRTWRYVKSEGRSTPMPVPTERFNPILIVRLADGRLFADQWADGMVLWESLDRWRNAQGYLIDWQSPIMEGIPTCAIGGKDWDDIPVTYKEWYRRQERERKLAAERSAA